MKLDKLNTVVDLATNLRSTEAKLKYSRSTRDSEVVKHFATNDRELAEVAAVAMRAKLLKRKEALEAQLLELGIEL